MAKVKKAGKEMEAHKEDLVVSNHYNNR